MTCLNESETNANQRFEQLVGPVRLDLVRYVLWLSKDRWLADEIVQNTLFRAWRSFDQLRDDRCLKPWLITIAHREHARHYERKRLDTKSIDELSTADEVFLSVTESTDVREMRGAILTLDSIYREPLILQVLLGFSMKEISSTMGLCGATVASRLHRARLMLIESHSRSEACGMVH